jgi:hypothetical protein
VLLKLVRKGSFWIKFSKFQVVEVASSSFFTDLIVSTTSRIFKFGFFAFDAKVKNKK